MEINEKINVRGAISLLEVGAPPLELPKSDYQPSSVRSTAAIITADTGKKFSVNSTDKEKIVVTRIS